MSKVPKSLFAFNALMPLAAYLGVFLPTMPSVFASMSSMGDEIVVTRAADPNLCQVVMSRGFKIRGSESIPEISVSYDTVFASPPRVYGEISVPFEHILPGILQVFKQHNFTLPPLNLIISKTELQKDSNGAIIAPAMITFHLLDNSRNRQARRISPSSKFFQIEGLNSKLPERLEDFQISFTQALIRLSLFHMFSQIPDYQSFQEFADGSVVSMENALMNDHYKSLVAITSKLLFGVMFDDKKSRSEVASDLGLTHVSKLMKARYEGVGSLCPDTKCLAEKFAEAFGENYRRTYLGLVPRFASATEIDSWLRHPYFKDGDELEGVDDAVKTLHIYDKTLHAGLRPRRQG